MITEIRAGVGKEELKKMKCIRFFVKNQINRSEFKVTFVILFLLGTGGMIMGYAQNYQNDLVFLRSAADNFLLTSTESRVIKMMFSLCFPLLAAALCTGYRRGNALFSMLRMNKKQYIYGNALVVIGITVISFMSVLGLNQLLCFVAFPLSGSDNRWGMTEYDLMNSFQADLLFDIWSVQNPYVYNLLYIVIISILAGGIAFLDYGLGYVKRLGQLKPVLLSVLVFLVFIALFVIGDLLDIPAISFLAYIEPGHAVNLVQYAAFTGCIYVLGMVLTIKGKKEYEYI